MVLQQGRKRGYCSVSDGAAGMQANGLAELYLVGKLNVGEALLCGAIHAPHLHITHASLSDQV